MESKSKTPLEESVEQLKHGFRQNVLAWPYFRFTLHTELQSAKRALAESQAALKLARTRIIESCKKIITESPDDMAVINAIDHALSSDAGSDYALKEELEAEKQYSNELAKDLCRLEDALGANCDIQGGGTDKAMERVRDLIAKEGELGDIQSQLEAAKALIKRFAAPDAGDCYIYVRYDARRYLGVPVTETEEKQLATLDSLRKELEAAKKAYEMSKDTMHRFQAFLILVEENLDAHADGAPDATPLGKFCNRLIGYLNEMRWKDCEVEL